MRRKNENPLALLRQLAEALDDREYLDATSPNQRRAMRKAADTVRGVMLEWSDDVTPQMLLCLWTGATMQAQLSTKDLPEALQAILGSTASVPPSPAVGLTVSIAYLARDVLAGERVE